MKNLANCKPSEFLKQTNRIRKSVQNWLTVTDIMNIRRTVPKFDEKQSAEERKAALAKQASENLSKMLDAIMDKHPDETLELLALLCFVEPEHVDDYKVSDYLISLNELVTDDAVMGFFTSLTQLAKNSGLTA